MKVVILAGGRGKRMKEQTMNKPKPMVKIGDKPLIWHVMKQYAQYNYTDFIIAGGYNVNVIKERLPVYCEDNWKVKIVDTGLSSTKSTRIKKLSGDLKSTFMLTWGDVISDINLDKLYDCHKNSDNIMTITGIPMKPRYGFLKFKDQQVTDFQEKEPRKNLLIHAAHFVVETEVFNYIQTSHVDLERDVFSELISHRKLGVYVHNGFWKSMDYIEDQVVLEHIWQKKGTWKIQD